VLFCGKKGVSHLQFLAKSEWKILLAAYWNVKAGHRLLEAGLLTEDLGSLNWQVVLFDFKLRGNMAMSDGDKKEEETADKKEPSQTNIYVSGNYIQGDQTTVGNISDSEGVAIGREASASVKKGSKPDQEAGDSAAGQVLDGRIVYKRIMDGFNLAEIEELCYQLDVEFENLGGTGKSGKARELVKYMERRGRLGELDLKVRELRGGE
jgi:hypothetical protein